MRDLGEFSVTVDGVGAAIPLYWFDVERTTPEFE